MNHSPNLQVGKELLEFIIPGAMLLVSIKLLTIVL